MRQRSFRRLCALAVGSLPWLTSCASAPPPHAAQPAAPSLNKISLLCAPGTQAAVFSAIGVPEGEQPQRVAVSGRSVYVLFEHRLVTLKTSAEGKLAVTMRLPESGAYTALDVDPQDGTVWLMTSHLVLEKVAPTGESSRVKLRKVEGEGGLGLLLAANGTLYARPGCASVWRISSDGTVQARAFPDVDRPAAAPTAADAEPVDTLHPRCTAVKLERGPDGALAALSEHKTYRLDAAGSWQEADVPWLRQAPKAEEHTVKGIDVEAARDATWYMPANYGTFFWKGRPAYLGGWGVHDTGTSKRNIFLVPQADGSLRELFEDCRGFPLKAVATDREGFAGITDRFVVFGSFATAPDLP